MSLLNMLSPAAALVSSMKSGSPEGLMKVVSPAAILSGSLDKKKKRGGVSQKMAKGGKVRGDGACIKGKTRGTMK